MLLAEAGCVFMGFILYISGVQGRANSICASKNSSVDLPCSAQHPTSSMKWFTVHRNGSEYVLNELSTDGNRVTYNMSEESNYTLIIKDLRESDAKSYCCSKTTETPELCWHNRTELYVSDLQVKVIPATEGQTVSLICNTSCPLTENPAAYIWYKNRTFLYQDWSPWYQQLVSSEEAVRYSCAIKDYKHLRAPEVSVDSVTSTCFTVTYAKGRMCSKKQTSVDGSCSITYPREVSLQRTPAEVNHVRLTCNTNCPLTDIQTAYRWYKNRLLMFEKKQQFSVPSSSPDVFSCAVKDHEDLHSAEVCVDDENCWSVNYIRRRICALEGSSVDISSEYLYPDNQQPESKVWYKIKRNGEEEAVKQTEDAVRMRYLDMNNQHILRIKNLKKTDSAEYIFRLLKDDEVRKGNPPGVTLIVSDLEVKLHPAVVTEGQRVTLTCSTSCPLTDNTNYIWYLNSRPLMVPESQNKHLVLDPVSIQHAGNYSCAVKTHQNINSGEKTLTVQSITGTSTAAVGVVTATIPATVEVVTATTPATVGVVAALLVIIPLTVFFWIRRKRSSSRSPRLETSDNMEQLNPGPVYEDISAQATEQDDLHYSSINFSKKQTDPLYTTVQPHQPQEQTHVLYAVVHFRSNTTPE
ncbi:contactin-1-like isoform X1 [Thunnus thynnus]|uniref:contactin-1-like isoform X1 n=1 Tax=Thunnus thynnus TaxID=8237 RepID=UPI003528EADD